MAKNARTTETDAPEDVPAVSPTAEGTKASANPYREGTAAYIGWEHLRKITADDAKKSR